MKIFLIIACICCFGGHLNAILTTKSSFSYYLGQNILSTSSNTALYYAYPSPYLFVYDDISQKIKSIDIETGTYNSFQQVDFQVGQMLFTPQAEVFMENSGVGNQILRWNYYSSFNLKNKTITVPFNSFKMKPFYPVYNKTTSDPFFYILVFSQSVIQIQDYDGNIISDFSNNIIEFTCVCPFPEEGYIVTGGTDGVIRLWKFVGLAGQKLQNNYNFSQMQANPIQFLERVKNTREFISADNVERKLKVWSLKELSLKRAYSVGFGETIAAIKSVSNRTAVVYGGAHLEYVNVENVSLIKSIDLNGLSIINVEALPLTLAGEERIAVLTNDGSVTVYVLNPTTGIIRTYNLFKPAFSAIGKILYAMGFKRRNTTDNGVISMMAVVSDSDKKSVHFINEMTLKNMNTMTYSTEIRGIFQIMGRFNPIYQDMMLVWYGNSYSIYQIQDSGYVKVYLSYSMPSGTTIESLGLVHNFTLFAYPYITVIDNNKILTILNITETNSNVTSYTEPAGVKFFCEQNFFTNFAYALPNNTLRVKKIDEKTLAITNVNLDSEMYHEDMTACFSKNLVGEGYYMTSNLIYTSTWKTDASFLSNQNLVNITSLVIEGNPLFTAVKSGDNKLYQLVVGVGTTHEYIIGLAPNKKGFLYQFIDNNYYMVNEKELGHLVVECPSGTAQAETLRGACMPSCYNGFISLKDSSCSQSCTSGTFSDTIYMTFSNLTHEVCRNFNSSILNCRYGNKKDNSSIQCTKCDDNYYLFSPLSAINSYNLCVAKGGDGRLATYSFSKTDGSGIAKWCNQFLNNCSYCNWNSSNCDLCEDYFYKTLDGPCNECTKNTEFHNGSFNGSGFCYNCSIAMPHCLICNGNSSNCTKCFRNYYFDEGLDLACTNCSSKYFAKTGLNDGTGFCRNCSKVLNNCIDCSEFGEKCTLCDQTFFIDIDDTCTKCTEINKYQEVSTTSGSGFCYYCNHSMPHCLNCYGNKKDCQLCMNSFYSYNESTCLDCLKPNLYQNGSNNGSGRCIDCYKARPNCLNCNNDPKHCDLCFEKYWFLENNTCVDCSAKKFPNSYKNGSDNGTGSCLYCKDAIGNCNQCTDNATQCTRCDANYFIDVKNFTCTLCNSEAVFKNSTADGSGKCYHCEQAFTNCVSCKYTENKCMNCSEDFYLNSQYRCQPYSFTPFINEITVSNKTLIFSTVKNRRYAIFSNPCKYDRTTWSLDKKVHVYWVASTDFQKVESTSYQDIVNILTSIDSNETSPNYLDPSWTFYGETKANNLLVTGRNDALYKVKYYCVYGNTFSEDTVPGLFQFYFPENTGNDGKLFLNMKDYIQKASLSLSLQILTCALESAIGLNATRQISTEDDKFCEPEILNLNGISKAKRRNLQNNFVTSDLNIAMTHIFYFRKNVVLVSDLSSSIAESKMAQSSFYVALADFLARYKSIVSIPEPVSGSFVVISNQGFLNSDYPIISPNFTSKSNTSGSLNFIVTNNDGVLYMGIQENQISNLTASQMKKGMTDESLNFKYYSIVLVTQNTRINLKMETLDVSKFYTFYYFGENLEGTNTSLVNAYKFISNFTKNITKKAEKPQEETDQTMVIAVVTSVIGCLLFTFLSLMIFRWWKLKHEKDKKDDFDAVEISPEKGVAKKGISARHMFFPSQEDVTNQIDPKMTETRI